MTELPHPRRPAPGRARKRLIRALATGAGVPYSVAARWIEDANAVLDGELPASEGRTVYPASTDTHRRWLIDCRDRRPAGERLQDARRAADLPRGRAAHLADRFPPTRGEDGTGVGPLYSGTGRRDLLALLYAVVAHESPELVPSIGDLAWVAELGEETAVDTACAGLDRAARLLLDGHPAALWPRVETALAAGGDHRDWWVREESDRLAAGYRAVAGQPLDGVGHILDALLVIADDGHAPGTRVRILADPNRRRTCTIVGAGWGPSGPPRRYRVHPDAAPRSVLAEPRELVVLPGWAR